MTIRDWAGVPVGRVAAVVAAAAIPTAYTGWANPVPAHAAEEAATQTAKCDPNAHAVTLVDTVPMIYHQLSYYREPLWVDPTNIAGQVQLRYSEECRMVQAVGSLINPLPQGKVARVSTVQTYYTHETAGCDIPVGGYGCTTAWSDDADILQYAEADVTPTDPDARYYWGGHTIAY
ncbi:hypothetical protein UG55_101048 [Frankia sp. EI5c]|uniref:hypothetical protein n=1 Tax=Frankia sp. EI5c TaxID=683316 RepID=UPI0007C3C737|nr:hypothetical protein [Frankia sp. EI5c]OAA27033.1 hypothetical protein UG55_101048 [Frankia sp. EI5c]